MGSVEQLGITREQLQEMLAGHAADAAPRLFSLYGVTRGEELDGMIGWGMDFGEDRGAVFYLPDEDTTWRSDSAESMHAKHQIFGDIQLRWLTDEPRRE